jgi:acyl-CoA synthetase (AMP-forming)/AMP-acid ligase II
MVYRSSFPDIDMPKGSVIEFIFANKMKTPEDKPVLIDALDGRFLTYSQLKDSVLQFAAGLQDECGFQDDDVLALYAPNQVS